MRLEQVERLIEMSDLAALREIAHLYLRTRGFQDASNIDGWNDGGGDFRVFDLGTGTSRYAIQTSIDRDWKTKLRSDAEKARERLGATQMLYITSRRIPEAEFVEQRDLIERTSGVTVERADNQRLASFFAAKPEALEKVLSICGIDVSSSETISPSCASGARGDALCAFVFFDSSSENFRERMIESAVLSESAHAGPLQRVVLESRASEALSLSTAQADMVVSAVDRLLQRGDLIGSAAALSCSPRTTQLVRSAQLLREKDWKDFRQKVFEILLPYNPKLAPEDESLNALMEALGSHLLCPLGEMLGLLEGKGGDDAAAARMRKLSAMLTSLGVSNEADRVRVTARLTEAAADAPAARRLVHGELFSALLGVQLPHLVRALGARDAITFVLDASVAIPMIATSLYGVHGGRYFRASSDLEEQFGARRVRVAIPTCYLEEVASHLVHAARDYAAIAELEPDLVSSENAFVSQFAGLRRDGEAVPFARYLQAFGYQPDFETLRFEEARNRVIERLKYLFSRKGVLVERLDPAEPDIRRRAEEAIARAEHELQIPKRPERLIAHDAEVVSNLMAGDADAREARVLCTWDRIPSHVASREHCVWTALNPAAAADLLGLLSENDSPTGLVSIRMLAGRMTEETSELGAKVWDQIARLEKDRLFDAQHLERAKSFKATFLKRLKFIKDAAEIEQAWLQWKKDNC